MVFLINGLILPFPVKIDMCRMCVILSAKTPSRLEPVLADKEVLLTTLNIKAMAFSGVEDSDTAVDGMTVDETDTQITNVSTTNLNSLKHRSVASFSPPKLPGYFYCVMNFFGRYWLFLKPDLTTEN